MISPALWGSARRRSLNGLDTSHAGEVMKRLLMTLWLIVATVNSLGCGASKEAGTDRAAQPSSSYDGEEDGGGSVSPQDSPYHYEAPAEFGPYETIESPPPTESPLEPIAVEPRLPVESVPVEPAPFVEASPPDAAFPVNPLRAPTESIAEMDASPPVTSSVLRPRMTMAAPLEAESPLAHPADISESAAMADIGRPESRVAAPEAAESTGPNEEATAAETPGDPQTIKIIAKARGADESQYPGYKVVNVFYGTDRRAAAREGAAWTDHAQRAALPSTLLLVTFGLGAASFRVSSRVSRQWLWSVTAVVFIAAGFVGYQAATSTLTTIRRAEHEGPRYTSDLGKQLQVGTCEITIPDTHKPGRVEKPSLLRLEVKENVLRHVRLRRTKPLQSDEFYEQLRQCVAQSPQQDLFIFIHGFNVTFEDAARRTAQMATDMKFQGAPVFFSWPAHDGFLATYLADEDHVATTTPHLKQFLLDVAAHSGARSVHLLAHSMGNRALAAALKELELELKDQARLFDQVVFAAPDVFTEQFQDTLAPYLTRTANRFTLYASSRDWALKASKFIHRGPRAGDSGAQLLVLSKIDTIDVTAVDSSPFGHSYYGASDPILRDIKELFVCACPPSQRAWLGPDNRDGKPYWKFETSNSSTARVTESSGSR